MIKKICVCGAGTMGKGIAQVMARAGYPVILYELNPVALQKARLDLNNEIQSLVDKGKISEEDGNKILQRISFSDVPEDCRAELVIEAIIESYEQKIKLFGQMESLNGDDCIYASNTSSISISRLAAGLRYPGQVIGMHFFNPAPVMKLVEVVSTSATATETTDAVLKLCKEIGKVPVACKDSPGFIVNRVARPFYIESLNIAEEMGPTVANFSKIDRMLESLGFRMGPFKLMDLIGNDVNYAVSESIYEQLQMPARLKPSTIQKDKVNTGELGRKSRKGYYEY